MADDLDTTILRALKQLQDDAQSAGSFDADAIAALANLPRWAVAAHVTRLAVMGYVRLDPDQASLPHYRLAPKGQARLLRTRAEPLVSRRKTSGARMAPDAATVETPG